MTLFTILHLVAVCFFFRGYSNVEKVQIKRFSFNPYLMIGISLILYILIPVIIYISSDKSTATKRAHVNIIAGWLAIVPELIIGTVITIGILLMLLIPRRSI